MLPFEYLVVAYCAFFVVAAPFTRVDRRQQRRAAFTAAALGTTVAALAQVLPVDARVWLALAYLALGYWAPTPLVPSTTTRAFEAWLVRTDEALRRHAVRLPRWLGHAVELAYLGCYPLVPAAFAVVWLYGSPFDVQRFWTVVLPSGYLCYATLPWLVSRPPRRIESAGEGPAPIARLNLLVLGRVSHQMNTFPSGHVAVAVAAAVVVSEVWWPAGLALWVMAAGIAVGAVAGRYHFTADVVTGALLGALVALPRW